MAKYKQLNEDIIINIQDNSLNNKITIFLRNTKNENTKIIYDQDKTKTIKELKLEVYIL